MTSPDLLINILIPIGSYFLGSIPFALLVTRWRSQRDLREHGSGHAGATNVLRVAGIGLALVVLLWDIGKGYLIMQLAQQQAATWVLPASAAAVVIGHCWPIFANFRGGMGVAASGGVLLGIWPLAFVLGVGLDAALTLTTRHAARANIFTGLTLWLLLLLFGAPAEAVSVAVAVGLVVAFRSLRDWEREYRELWLDRPEESQE